ncbi:c-type cytochrome [uncultured Helicobacter sp.]|uniref:c-type cytochrome n=1 Tax=uncultured Helicobacter sp. TaxID=175537 RepID=UPI00374FA17A
MPDTQDSLAQPQEPHAPEFDNEGFITFREYGKNLYENPRGIGCHHCHGQKGEGSIIAHYTHKGNAKTLSAPAINTLEFSVFAKALDSQKLGVMPRYYLTQKEIQAIYFYLYE